MRLDVACYDRLEQCDVAACNVGLGGMGVVVCGCHNVDATLGTERCLWRLWMRKCGVVDEEASSLTLSHILGKKGEGAPRKACGCP